MNFIIIHLWLAQIGVMELAGNCNALDDPSAKVHISNKTEDVNLKV